ncbi:alpha/beta fold hydrolase [Streptomyces ficellus]|uniref:Alpha/beta hydrolase n=1 Tax=Streptomyces ficellus TaxID=1977088 RepID=A0A6I6F792_9ACTN|nr:alpha/beta hydrolase [Streptomyces ficellus]QGV76877.1 alpha/beta hydrolase [Streptomyces ficellus]
MTETGPTTDTTTGPKTDTTTGPTTDATTGTTTDATTGTTTDATTGTTTDATTGTTTDTRTLDAPGATLTYDVRRPDGDGTAGRHRPLLLIGSPMDAAGFATLAGHFADRTVVTYDPRGTARSPRTDGAARTAPEEHADDVRRVIEAVGAGPVDLFASSGGAVNALALVARHGELVATLVAHEPPTTQVLPDREAAFAVCEDIHTTYLRQGMGPAMAKFIVTAGHKGLFTENWHDQPAPDPAAFGLPAEDDGSRDDPLLGQNMLGCTGYRPDIVALRATSTRVVVAAGKESEGEFPARAAAELARELGTDLTLFPSHHGGFLGGEYGQHGAPEEFAQTLRAVLADAG